MIDQLINSDLYKCNKGNLCKTHKQVNTKLNPIYIYAIIEVLAFLYWQEYNMESASMVNLVLQIIERERERWGVNLGSYFPKIIMNKRYLQRVHRGGHI